MKKGSFVVLIAATMVISLVFWAVFTSLIAWGVVLLTGALHGSGLTQIPALSFWQSVGVIVLLSLLTVPLRAGRRSDRSTGR